MGVQHCLHVTLSMTKLCHIVMIPEQPGVAGYHSNMSDSDAEWGKNVIYFACSGKVHNINILRKIIRIQW